MKYVAVLICGLCMLFSLSACKLNYEKPQEVFSKLDGIAAKIGQTQITEDDDLIGKRTCEDAYTGRYDVKCNGETGRDVIFGGASINSRKLHVYGMLNTNSGTAVVRVRQNEDVTELEVQTDGSFEKDLTCSSGGNYIMVNYEDFCGTLELHVEYGLSE